jgi:hypothetical protein
LGAQQRPDPPGTFSGINMLGQLEAALQQRRVLACGVGADEFVGHLPRFAHTAAVQEETVFQPQMFDQFDPRQHFRTARTADREIGLKHDASFAVGARVGKASV